ncbi:DUF3545 family protein [Psychromonas sp. MME2]|uniref:DUF3545 family protein n=1 Tax=unclassified Psychromonas TaxID=2614957 RepID=UPI00339C5585
MQYDNHYFEVDSTHLLHLSTRKKAPKVRKWREIEAFKARQALTKELYDLDPTFQLSSLDFL